MFRLRLASACVRRSLYTGPGNRDLVLDQLQVCSSEDQVFEVVGRNKAKLAVNHVGCAVGMLWQFQKEKPQLLRTVGAVKSHPQFLTLRVLAENKISLMDDCLLVDMLYDVLRYSETRLQTRIEAKYFAPNNKVCFLLLSDSTWNLMTR